MLLVANTTKISCNGKITLSSFFSSTVIHCEHPPYIANATQIGHGTSYGSIVAYECTLGYTFRLQGHTIEEPSTRDSITIHCRETKHWSEEPGPCLSQKLLCLFRRAFVFVAVE